MSAAPQSERELAADASPVKILLVDDDRDSLTALEALLEPLDQELMRAQNREDALRLCLNHDFAAILLDVRMPGMDGFETAALIRSRKKSRHTPILFLTARRSDEQLLRGYDLGAVDFVFKPIVPELLQSKVLGFVELSRSEQLLRRQAEELTRAEQRFRAVLEAAPDAMLITSDWGDIELSNSRTDAMFGYSREALMGRNIRDLIPEWEPAPTLPPAPLTEKSLTGVRSDGSAFAARITRSRFPCSGVWLITTAIRDATEQVEAEERIRKANAELERRVAQRTAALTYSNDALRQFAWAASHDLQEPIRTVLSYSQWLTSADVEASQESRARMLAIIQDHAGRLYELLGALRQYIQVSEPGALGGADAAATLVDCQAVLRQVTANLQRLIKESGAVVEWGSMPTVWGVETLLVQLFQNLVANAIQHRSAQTPVIRVQAEMSDGEWIFSVEDNGAGIDPKYTDYIFGVFRRLNRGGGAGMGLAICKAVVERLGGRIWVESSAPGAGSTFRFSVPQRVG